MENEMYLAYSSYRLKRLESAGHVRVPASKPRQSEMSLNGTKAKYPNGRYSDAMR
jgi:hypothetical protein